MATALCLTLLVFVPLCWAQDANNNADNDVLNKMKIMQETMASLLDTVEKQTKELTKIQWLENEKRKSDEAIKSLQSTVKSLESRLVHPNGNNVTTAAASADTLFLATISAESIPISDDEVIVFDTDPINPGGHYNTVFGGYTAPFNGYYQFSVTKKSSDLQCRFWILVDEQRYAYYSIWVSADGGTTPSCSATINLQLTTGQIVRIENDASTVIYGTSSAGHTNSWFTGYMLYAL